MLALQKKDFDLHLQAVSLLSESDQYIPKIINRLNQESIDSLGLEWHKNWNRNLPSWQNTPGGINIPSSLAFKLNRLVRFRRICSLKIPIT